LAQTTKINIHTAINWPVVLYGHKSWSLILREKHRLKVFEVGVLREIYGPNWDKYQETGENCIMRS
jgi:hypothetical protein